jgi:membrane-associated phospholipid phosphatase
MILLAGIIGSSRIKLKAHNTLQIIAGFYLGIITVYTTIMLY